MTSLRIGDLALLGGVSVRMLRHYHSLGLLEPEHVDPHTGYRLYNLSQIDRLQSIVQLRAIGMSLSDIDQILSSTEPALTRQLLERRRTTIKYEIGKADSALEQIDTYLQQLDKTEQTTQKEHRMTTPTKPIEVEMKAVPARLVAQLTAVADSWEPEDIGPTIGPLYPELISRMEKAGVAITGPSTAWYEDTADGKILVHATLTIGERPAADPASLGFEIVELPAIDKVASTIHTGSMDDCDVTYDALIEWIETNGHSTVGYGREIDIECEPDKPWIVELQQPVTS